jgi:hypothetical protein
MMSGRQDSTPAGKHDGQQACNKTFRRASKPDSKPTYNHDGRPASKQIIRNAGFHASQTASKQSSLQAIRPGSQLTDRPAGTVPFGLCDA